MFLRQLFTSASFTAQPDASSRRQRQRRALASAVAASRRQCQFDSLEQRVLLATVSINDVTLTEADAGTSSATFTVTLSEVSATPVSVDYRTVAGTATAGSDFTTTSDTLVIPAGETTATINIPVVGDTTYEADESFTVVLEDPVGATLGDSTGTATILNNDPPGLSIGNAALTEGNSGTSTMNFTVTLAAALGTPVTVQYATANGSATAGTDYIATSGTLTIPAGQTTATIPVLIVGDTDIESNETFTITLSNPVGAPINNATGTGTINNNDNPSLSVNDVTITEGNSGTTNATFTITLSAVVGSAVSVQFATSSGTATSGSDFTSVTQTVTIQAGQTTATVNVPILGDSTYEPNETFNVTLSNVTGPLVVLGDSTGTGTIQNDDPITVSVSDATVTEGNSGTSNMTFTVSIPAVLPNEVVVQYATTDGTATSVGSARDFNGVSGTVTIPAGQTSASVTVVIIGDTTIEPDETFTLTLTSATGAPLGDATGTGTITNNDLPVVSINDVSVNEGNSATTDATFTITLSAPAPSDVSVVFTTSNGTATAGTDYTARTQQTITIPAGQTTATVTVLVAGDTVFEIDETFVATLTLPSGTAKVTLGDATGLGTIRNDDVISLSISDATIAEGNSGTQEATFTVSVPVALGTELTVQYATVDGTATAGTDYTSTSGTLTIAAGQTSGTIKVPILGDTLAETNENFRVVLSNATGAPIADPEGFGTITNDDNAVLSIGDVNISEGDSGTSQATFTVTMAATTSTAVTLAYATANGTGLAGTDYEAASGTLTFEPGETSKTITVSILGNTTVQGSRTFFVNLSNAVGATLGDAQAVGTILDDDSAPLITIDDATTLEGNSATEPFQANFAVRLSAASGRTITVQYTTAADTASAGDFTGVTEAQTVTFQPGETTKTISINITGDTTAESIERFFVNLANASGGTLSDAQAIGTILDDDVVSPAPEIRVQQVKNSGNVEIQDNQSNAISFGNVRVGATPPQRQFRVTNTGTSTLTLDRIRLPKGFELVNGLPGSLAAGKSNSFTVRMLTDVPASRSAKIKIPNNDANEAPFEIPITGTIGRTRTRSLVRSVPAQAMAASPTVATPFAATRRISDLLGGSDDVLQGRAG